MRSCTRCEAIGYLPPPSPPRARDPRLPGKASHNSRAGRRPQKVGAVSRERSCGSTALANAPPKAGMGKAREVNEGEGEVWASRAGSPKLRSRDAANCGPVQPWWVNQVAAGQALSPSRTSTVPPGLRLLPGPSSPLPYSEQKVLAVTFRGVF